MQSHRVALLMCRAGRVAAAQAVAPVRHCSASSKTATAAAAASVACGNVVERVYTGSVSSSVATLGFTSQQHQHQHQHHHQKQHYSSSFTAMATAVVAACTAGAAVAAAGSSDGSSDVETEITALRMRSEESLEGVFNALASSSKDGVRYMTFRDFCRSRLYKQYGFDGELHIHQLLQSEARLGDEAGRISYAGFRFLSAMLAVPTEHVAVSFLVCDSDGNGAVDKQELVKTARRLTRSSPGHGIPETDATEVIQSRLAAHLFGRPGREKGIDFKRFSQFVRELKLDMLTVEFMHYSDGGDKLSYRQFGRFLAAHSGADRIRERLDRLSKLADLKSSGFTLQEFLDFNFAVLENASGIAEALTLADNPGGVTPAKLAHIVRVVSGVALPEMMVRVLYTMFDSDGGNLLNGDEMFDVLHTRALHLQGARNKRTTGLAHFLECITKKSDVM